MPHLPQKYFFTSLFTQQILIQCLLSGRQSEHKGEQRKHTSYALGAYNLIGNQHQSNNPIQKCTSEWWCKSKYSALWAYSKEICPRQRGKTSWRLCILFLELFHQQLGEGSISKKRISSGHPKVLSWGQPLTIYLCIQSWPCFSTGLAEIELNMRDEATLWHKPHIIQHLQTRAAQSWSLSMRDACSIMAGFAGTPVGPTALSSTIFLQWHRM